MSVLQLDQLNQPLHIRKAATPQLQLPSTVRPVRHALMLHARLHAPHLLHLLHSELTRIPVRVNQLNKRTPQLLRTGDRARPQERLKLPCLCPALIVGAVRIQRAHQCPLLTFRAQIRVYFKRAFGADCRAYRLFNQLHQPVHNAVRLRLGFTLVCPLHGAMHKHHVRVGAETVLCTAQTTHRYHRYLGQQRILLLVFGALSRRFLRIVLRCVFFLGRGFLVALPCLDLFAFRQGERRANGTLVHGRQPGAHLLHAQQIQGVPHGDAQNLAAAQVPYRAHSVRRIFMS